MTGNAPIHGTAGYDGPLDALFAKAGMAMGSRDDPGKRPGHPGADGTAKGGRA